MIVYELAQIEDTLEPYSDDRWVETFLFSSSEKAHAKGQEWQINAPEGFEREYFVTEKEVL